MKKVAAMFVLIAILLAAACTPQATPTPEPPLPSPSPMPPTWTPVPPPTATPTATATPFQPFEAKALTDYLNVRENPGYLFAIETQLAKDTPFKVLGKSPGGEWIYVELEDGTNGWIFAQLIVSELDLQLAPLREPQDVQLVTGMVKNTAGEPINGIQFMVQGAVTSSPRTDAVTDGNGVFYAYLPKDASGKWYVSFTAISCTSNTMDADCNCLNGVCGTITPAVENVTLPQSALLEFLWQ